MFQAQICPKTITEICINYQFLRIKVLATINPRKQVQQIKGATNSLTYSVVGGSLVGWGRPNGSRVMFYVPVDTCFSPPTLSQRYK